MARKFPWQAPATRVDRVNVGRNLMKLAVAVMLAGLIVAVEKREPPGHRFDNVRRGTPPRLKEVMLSMDFKGHESRCALHDGRIPLVIEVSPQEETHAYHTKLWFVLVGAHLCKLKVDQTRAALRIDQNIAITEVAMHPAVFVQDTEDWPCVSSASGRNKNETHL